MPDKLKLSVRNLTLYAIIVLVLCTLFLSFACTTPTQSTTPPQQQDQEPASSSDMPDTTTNPPEQQVDSGWKADTVISADEYDRLASYDDGKYEIAWTSDAEFIYVFVRAQAEGFVAIGIQPDMTMQQADIIFGAVKNGKASVTDEYSAHAFGPHGPDVDFEGGTNDIIDYAGIESVGYTIIEFKRKLNTGDIYDHPLTKGVNKIIWAYGSSDDPQVKHVSRGYGQIEL